MRYTSFIDFLFQNNHLHFFDIFRQFRIILKGQTRTCQELAAQENYKAKANENPALRIYSKYYKRYAARVRSKQLKEKEFKTWKYKALTMRDECTDGNITAEEYVAWLEAYFPNRKQPN
mgnify:CR=1 FL=1